MSGSIQGTDAEILYHYTSPEGLLGILKEGLVWAGDARFSNDWMEIEHGLELLKTLLFDVEENTRTAAEKDVLTQLQHIWTSFRNKQTAYVFALTEKDDDLSQWRGYTPSCGGYAIGLRTDKLGERVQDLGLSAAPCIYSLDEKRKKLQDSVEYMLRDGAKALMALRIAYKDRSKLSDAVGVIESAGLAFGLQQRKREFIEKIFHSKKEIVDELIVGFVTFEFAGLIASYSAVFKDDSFRDENEVRIIHIPRIELISSYTVGRKHKFGFKTRYGMIVPYAELPILNSENRSILSEIVIGPRSQGDKSLSEKTLRFLLRESGFDECKVRSSKIPFRSE